MQKKLVALNLAMILMISLVFSSPAAYATDGGDQSARTYTQAEGVPIDGPSQANAQKAMKSGLNADLMDVSPYQIVVGGTSFNSDTNASGSGWSYDPSSNYGTLTLNNYSGGPITSLGYLTIYSYGVVTVKGDSGTNGSNAITVSGNLDLFIMSGTTTIIGGSGTAFGGVGISATSLWVLSFVNDANFDCSGGVGSNNGGYGIVGNYISVDVYHATISGGSSSTYAGYGIVYANALYIDNTVNGYITVQAGSASVYAIASTGSNPFYFNRYADVINEGWRFTFSPKVFTLTLSGAGGLYNAQSNVSRSGVYPTSTYLGDYLFTRAGYQQYGWVRGWTTGTDLVNLSATYVPTSNTTLYANWAPFPSDTVMFIGNGGLINGQGYAWTPADTSVHVPSRSNTVNTISTNSSLYLLGWTDQLKLTTDETDMLNSANKWYSPGSMVNIGVQSTFYAQWANYGNIVYYDGNGGVSTGGSTNMVQARLTSASSLSLTIPSSTGLAKSGYTLTGWKGGSGTSYAAGQVINQTSPLTVTSLIAQWARTYTLTLNGNSGMLNGSATDVVPSYEGKVENLANFAFTRSGYMLTGWNTSPDGSGAFYPANTLQTMTGDITLYAQWTESGSTFTAMSPDHQDAMTCIVAQTVNKVNVSLQVTGVINSSQNSVSLPVCYALYQGGRLVGVFSKNVNVTGSGMTDNATISYIGSIQPTSCKVFILNNGNYIPARPPILCTFGSGTPNFLGITSMASSLTKDSLSAAYTWDNNIAVTVNGNSNIIGSLDSTVFAQVGATTAYPFNANAALSPYGRGQLVSFCDTDGNGAVDKVVITSSYLAYISDVKEATATSARTITAKIYNAGTPITVSIPTDNFAKGSYVLVTPNFSLDTTHTSVAGMSLTCYETPAAIAAASNISGTLTAYSTIFPALTIGGITYLINSLAYDIPATYSFTANYTYYLANGCIIGVITP